MRPHKLFYSVSFLQFFMSEITGTTLILFLLAKGLSLQSANFLLVVFFVSIFLFEIPTGAIADKYGRKISIVLGLCCFLVYSVLFVWTDRMWLLVFAQVFGGWQYACNQARWNPGLWKTVISPWKFFLQPQTVYSTFRDLFVVCWGPSSQHLTIHFPGQPALSLLSYVLFYATFI